MFHKLWKDNFSKPSSSSTQSSTNTTSEQASLIQDREKVEEFAANASTSFSNSLSPQYSPSLRWCADTGASSHMTPHRAWFETYQSYSVPIRVADGTVVKSAGIGTVRFLPRLQGAQSREVVFHRVLHVPSLQNNLLSVLYLTSKRGFRVVVENHTMHFEHNGALLFTATQHGQLAYLDGSVQLPHAAFSAASASLLPLTLDLWHRRFAHMGMGDLMHLFSSNVVTGLHLDSKSSPDPVCEPCIAGKQHRIINKTATRSRVPLEIVHCDLHGPMPVASIDGHHKYFIIFVDDATRLWALYFLRSKSQAAEAFLTFRAAIEKQTGFQIKVLHDDKEGGLSSNEFNAQLCKLGIQRRFTMRSEPHSNGVAERAIRSIADSATSMLYESHLPSSFWSKAVSNAVYLHNRLPTAANNGLTPYELMFKKKPDVSLVRVFGCMSYVHVKKDQRSGFSSHMQKAIFVGYPTQQKGWEFFNPITKKWVLSDRADFDERVFPGLATQVPEPPAFPTPPTSQLPSNSTHLIPIIKDDDDDEMHQKVGDPVGVTDPSSTKPSNPPATLATPTALAPHPVSPPASQHPPPPPAQPEQLLRRSGRARVPPHIWQQNWFKPSYNPQEHLVPPQPPPPPPPVQQYCDPAPQIPSSDEEDEPEPEQSTSESESDESELLASECAYLTIPEALEVAFKASAHDDSPKSYAEAMTCPDAQYHHDAALKEIKALLDNGTWELASLPPGHKAIGCRWVFVIKCKSDGSIDRYKA